MPQRLDLQGFERYFCILAKNSESLYFASFRQIDENSILVYFHEKGIDFLAHLCYHLSRVIMYHYCIAFRYPEFII